MRATVLDAFSYNLRVAALQVTDLGVDPTATHYDRLLVEAEDAILGLYSVESGNAGSALTFATMEADALVDKWALIRETTAGGSGLRFTYGTDDDQWQNSTFMYLDDTGAVGIGTRTPDARLDVSADGTWIQEVPLRGITPNTRIGAGPSPLAAAARSVMRAV